MIERANCRRERIKIQYKELELKERRNILSKQFKYEKILQELRKFEGDFGDFMLDFDKDMDHLANKASYDSFK